MGMSGFCKAFNIQNHQCRIGNGFPEYRFGIRLESRFQFLIGTIRVNKCKGDTHFLHGNSKKVISTAIYSRGRYHMIPSLTQVEYGIEVCRLTGRSQHCCCAAFQCTNFLCYPIAGGILQTCIKIPFCFQIEQLTHFFTTVILKCSALNDGQQSGLSVCG